ncbi:electron transfer flavoprotein-quinone oxidoreductase [Arcanobacterium wilhelmae]|uniref:Electron transfer flavoprotein-quinone oxidoreductase n=1 Tax=Arcanobacterium wilhelmae TaxID=1803177 RepID=A0ABT9N9D1_9ACTO|nr:FAD-dependent oxidoreductase [Arcanobacterium wilhelmae]MDP9800317.1 electron transfer flavoprotein-quinone oxidoreductase [Arcanobacterium wilhelmae]WFN89753.1 FAD-dependent oxidoreductase [Arcanobacterium wilhelmae]
MTDYDFDVIVVGAGVAGSVAAYLLAKQGHEVLLIERGETVGEKNLSGGVFYSQVMEEIMPGFAANAPVERVITRNVVSFLNEKSSINIEYTDERLAEPVNAVSVLRAKLDPWLAEQAEEAGATVMSGIKVESLLREGPYFTGVEAGGEQLRAKVTILADGVNSFLAQGAGIREKQPQQNLALGVKSVIKLPRAVIEDRFHLTGNEGTAYAIVGDATKGVLGGGFLYTNQESISLGIVVKLDDFAKSGMKATDIHDYYITHPAIAPLIKDGKLLEYGSHLVAEGGEEMMGELVHDGLVIVGDAGGFTLNTGLTIRGMDLAAGSARDAARAVHEALEADDYSRLALAQYAENLAASEVGKDMHTYRRAPEFLETRELFGDVGQLLADVFYGIFNLDTTPRKSLVATAWGAFRKGPISLVQLVSIAWKGVRSL